MASVATPQIGVLCIDVARQLMDMFPHDNILSYIPASYVKFLEDAGAEAVPVWIGYGRAYYEEILSKLNGLLIPGGAVNFLTMPECELPNDCVLAAKYIYELAKQQNDRGIYFPIWGTCLGFQLIIYHSAKGESSHKVRGDCSRMNYCLSMLFESDFRNSKMFGKLSEGMEQILKTEPFGYHYHRYGITREALVRHQIDGEWQILATNKDANGLEFISFVEHKRYPFYGSQVHLERNAYELLGETDNCVHTAPCIEASQYFAKFFVSECKKCPNHFDNDSERMRHSIRNFSAKSTNHHPEPHWLECYMFGRSPKYPEDSTLVPE